jgi:nucleoid-associated protein YgaU
VLSLGLTVIALECTKKLTVEVQQAEKAVEKARNAGAEEWAKDTFQNALDKLNIGKRLNESKKIKEAKAAFDQAIALSETAINEAIAAKKAAAEKEEAEKEPEVKTSHHVERGDYLWKIAGYSDVYGDSYKWYSIYKDNQGKIDGNYDRYVAWTEAQGAEKLYDHPAQLIYAGWDLSIPR